MQNRKGRFVLVQFILAGMIALTGCAQEEAPGGVTDVSGALFLSENESSEETAEASAEVALTTGTQITEISAAAQEDTAKERARKLTEEELAQMQEFINEEGSYGFLLSTYERPQDLDAGQVFYTGAGLPLDPVTEEERDAYLEETGGDEAVNLFRLTAQQVDDYLQYSAGISVEELTQSPDWVYLEDYDAYYICHGDEDTNRCTFEVTDAAVQGDYYRVHYRNKREAGDLDGWYIPVYEAILKKNGDTYRFCANRLWMEKDLLLQSYRTMALDSGDVVSFCSYKPDTDYSENADVTFALIKDGHFICNLPGMDARNIRTHMVFDEVRAIETADYDGDGKSEIAVICEYDHDRESEGREDKLEARIYRFAEDGQPVLDEKLSGKINKNVKTLTLSGIAYYIKNGEDRKVYESREEAFADEIATVDPALYDRFALIYVNDDKYPELLEMGTAPETGARIVFYHDGVLEETQVTDEFAFLRKENFLYCKNGTENLFWEALYVYAGNRLRVNQSGTYGTRDAAVTTFRKDGTPAYTYVWEGSPVTEAGYKDALFFVFDKQRAESSDKIKTVSAEELLAELRK